MQLSDKTTKEWSVNDILNWTIEGINALNAKVDALVASKPSTAGGASAKDVVDEFYKRLKD